MKIKRYNESFESDIYYKGNMIIEFEIDRSNIIKYSGIFTDYQIEKFGINGILEKYIFSSLNNDHEVKYKGNFKTFNKIVDYNLFDSEGNIIDEKIFNNITKFNI